MQKTANTSKCMVCIFSQNLNYSAGSVVLGMPNSKNILSKTRGSSKQNSFGFILGSTHMSSDIDSKANCLYRQRQSRTRGMIEQTKEGQVLVMEIGKGF